jgi:hypothetical protein
VSPLRPTSRTRSRWLWIGGLLLTSGIALYALSIALATTDTSRIVADAGQIQPLMVVVSEAAPGPGALTSAPRAADAAIAALDFHVAGLMRQLQGKLGSEPLAAEFADLESALATFTQAARGIPGGFVETNHNSDSFVVATQRVDALIDSMVERSEAGLARSDAAIVAAISALLLGGGLGDEPSEELRDVA